MTRRITLLLLLLPWGSAVGVAQPGPGQDDKILERGDKLLEEAKTAYEEALTKGSLSLFSDASFKLEESRIRFIVLQESGSPDKQKIAADRLRAVNQLDKLIHDGMAALSGTPEGEASPKPPPPALPMVDVTRRAPVPDLARQREAEKLIKDLFKDQYAKKAPADRKALARMLLDQAAKSRDDVAALWVLLREAQDTAALSCDVKTSMEAVDAASIAFDVDPVPMKIAALATSGKAAKTPEDFEALSVANLDLVEECIRADLYDLADKTAATALLWAKKSNLPGLASRASARTREISEAKSIYQGMKSVMATLAKSSEDPGANLDMGKYLCFVKGSWDLGLRFLVKGSDASLKGLAEKELALSLQVADRVAVADGWYELSEKEKSPLRKGQLLAHARGLYEAVLPEAPSLQRIRIEKRLLDPPRAEGTGINLLPFVDPVKDQVCGVWKITPKGLLSPKVVDSLVQVPYVPPEEYDLEVMAELLDGDDGLGIGFAHGNTQGMLVIGSWGQTISGLRLIDGVLEHENPTSQKGPVFTKGKTSRIVCSVRRMSIDVSVDGRKLLTWKADYSKISPGRWAVPRKDTLFLCSINTVYEISRLYLTPLSGQGKKIR